MGIGIVGKEGKQACLAADFSLTQFSHVGPLLMVHGRNSYKRSASLSQFVIHRGLIITVMQVILKNHHHHHSQGPNHHSYAVHIHGSIFWTNSDFLNLFFCLLFLFSRILTFIFIKIGGISNKIYHFFSIFSCFMKKMIFFEKNDFFEKF